MSRSRQFRIVGPLASFLPEVERSLLARGYSCFSTSNRLGYVSQLSRWMLRRHLAADSLRRSHLQEFVRFKRRSSPTFCPGYLESVVKSLIEVGAIDQPVPLPVPLPDRVDRVLEPFVQHLRQERVLMSGPGPYAKVIRRFLIHRFGSRTPRPQGIIANDLTQFVLQESRRFSNSTVKHSVTALRAYVRFLHLSGTIQHDLTGAIPAIAGWRLLGIPRGISPQQLSRLLSAPDRRTLIGRRDYAILLLLARLGLRRHEVAGLTLEDIDWPQGELRIHGKGEKHERLPLPAEAGAALAEHLRIRGRHQHSHSRARAVFLGARTPFRVLSPTAISGVVRKNALQAGLPPFSAHCLRHTVATQILRQGGGLDEIAQLLRHSSHDTTAIYAKVDLTALRAVAQPWPGRTS